jgi:DNA-binding transcriptional LysR family regulator
MDNIQLTEYDLTKNLKKISIDYMHYFVILAQVKNFSKASSFLNITQQALSKAISNLEDQLKIRLIERDKKFKKLTPAGHILLDKAQIIIKNLYDIENGLEELKEERNTLKVAWVGYMGYHSLPKLIYNYIEQCPDIFPKVNYMFTLDNVEESILSGEYDIGFLPAKPNKALNYIEGPKIPFVIVGKPQEKKHWSELPYIVPRFNRGPVSNKSSTNIWNESLYPRKIIAEVDTLYLAAKFCELGYGALFVPEIAVKGKIEKKQLAIIADPPFEMEIELYLIWNGKVPLKKGVGSFIKFSEKYIQKKLF